jgi:hypothetical protein
MIQNWAQGTLGAQAFNPSHIPNPQVIQLLQLVSQQLQQLQQIEYVRLQQLQQVQQIVQYVAQQLLGTPHPLAQPSLGGLTQALGQPYQSFGAGLPASFQSSPLQVM